MGYVFSSDADFEMRRNNILPVFWNYFKSIKQDESQHIITKLKLEANELLDGVSETVGIRNLQYYVLTGNNEKMKSFFSQKIKELTLHVKQRVELTDEQKVANQIHLLYYECDNIPFRTLYDNITTIYHFIRPVAPDFDILRFYKQLFRQVDFESLSDTYSKENNFEVIESPLTISEGLEALRNIYLNLSYCKDEVGIAINKWHLKIAELSSSEVIFVKNHLVATLGSLKIQAMTRIPGTDFYSRFQQISNSLKEQDRLGDSDYKMLIVNFAEIMANDLMGTFEIIIESLDRIIPKAESLKNEKPTVGKRNPQLPAPIIGLFCYILNYCGHIPKGENESIQLYCKRVCAKYNLPYADRVRQNFRGNNIKNNRTRVSELILPLVDPKTSDAISEYLNKK